MTPKSLDQCYEKDEILAALRGLSEEEIRRIQRFARSRFMGQSPRPGFVEAEDLFIQAVIRTINGKRRWKRGVNPFNHFLAVMRSIGHQRLKQASRYRPLSDAIADLPTWNQSALNAQISVVRLKEQLRGDVIALNVLESMLDETRPRDTQKSLGISSKVYWAARKRIRRQAEILPGAPCCQRRMSVLKAATDSVSSSTARTPVPCPEAERAKAECDRGYTHENTVSAILR